MKQTAVDFAVQQLENLIPSGNQIIIGIILQKAKEIENEQIQDAFDIGFCEGFDFGYRDFDPTYESGEMYYDKTYGKK
jgi:hypothetical protein